VTPERQKGGDLDTRIPDVNVVMALWFD